jgi:predicted DNA-binding transcriptional regulator AlpA
MPEQREGRSRNGPVTSYPETAVLSSQQVCEALGISRTTLWRLNLPSVKLGARTRRYVWRQILAVLEDRSV